MRRKRKNVNLIRSKLNGKKKKTSALEAARARRHSTHKRRGKSETFKAIYFGSDRMASKKQKTTETKSVGQKANGKTQSKPKSTEKARIKDEDFTAGAL